MSVGAVLDVGERLEGVGDPGRIAHSLEVGMAEHVSGTVYAITGTEAPRAQSATRCSGGLVCHSYDSLRMLLCQRIVGEKLVVLLWEYRVVHVVDDLDKVLGLALPRPEPKSRTTDGHGPGRGENEYAGTNRLRSIDDVLGALNIDTRRSVQETWVSLVETDIGCGVENGEFCGLGGIRPRGLERGVNRDAVRYVYFEKNDFGCRTRFKVFSR